MKEMEKIWKAQYDKRATLDIPDHKKSFWSKDGQEQLLEVTLHLVDKIGGAKTILDVGCGPGLYCEKLNENGYDIIGVDYSENTIELAKQKYPGITFMVADGYNLPFQDNQFDIVLSIGALQCIIEHEKFLKELIRVSSKAVILSTLLKKKKSKDPMRTLREQLKADAFPCREYHPSEILPIFKNAGMTTSVITTHDNKEISEGGFIVARH
jgi:ubiquinone/menaquinone biosynthesis C-methylase UbiE